MKEYWFARRFPLSDQRRAMAPVHWKGYAVSIVYVVALLFGGGLFVFLGMTERMMEGVAVFGVIAFVAAAWFMLTAKANGDPVRTVADYKKDKAGV
ncbi:MAG: hypothetical protein AB7O98_08365 [Hyphomonadaceae bacterium]